MRTAASNGGKTRSTARLKRSAITPPGRRLSGGGFCSRHAARTRQAWLSWAGWNAKNTATARYVLAEGVVAPVGTPKVLTQKTRSKTWIQDDVGSEYLCLRTVVQWIWKKHKVIVGRGPPSSIAAWLASCESTPYAVPAGADAEFTGELVIGAALAPAPAAAVAPAAAPAAVADGSSSDGSSSSSTSSS